jgi:hypothetical protein
MPESKSTVLNYLVVREVVADGKTAPCGDYRGHKVELGVHYQGQIVWQKPEYTMELPIQDGVFLSTEVGVTEHIASGAILIL